jgi:hypothetical protein
MFYKCSCVNSPNGYLLRFGWNWETTVHYSHTWEQNRVSLSVGTRIHWKESVHSVWYVIGGTSPIVTEMERSANT